MHSPVKILITPTTQDVPTIKFFKALATPKNLCTGCVANGAFPGIALFLCIEHILELAFGTPTEIYIRPGCVGCNLAFLITAGPFHNTGKV